jgi:NADPH2:quinone reductase
MTHAIRIHQFGSPEVLRWEEVEVRDVRPNEVRMRHTAVGLNYVEVVQRMGRFPFRLPFIPGNEGAGVIEAVGAEVSEFRPGDRVAYAPIPGSYSEARVIAADRLVKIPDGITDETAAAMMLQGMTAQYLLRQIYKVGPGDVVLVQAAAGGMGVFLCQWAAALGATVLGTVSTEDKAAFAKANGCHHPILYTRVNVPEEVKKITHGAMATVAYDAVGGDVFAGSVDSLRVRGHLVSYGNAAGPIPPLDLQKFGARGTLTVTRGTLASYTETRAGILECANDLFDFVRSGKVKVQIKQRFALRDAADAHRALEARQTIGSSIMLP